MAGELPSSVSPDQLIAARLRRQINEFAARSEYHSGIPRNLKKIAIDTAIETIMLDETALLLKAGELDSLAIENSFARAENEASGGILAQDRTLRSELAKLGGRSFEDNQRIANDRLRLAIVSRQSRTRLAEELGYQPGQRIKIVTREDFNAANNLAWQATNEFSSKTK